MGGGGEGISNIQVSYGYREWGRLGQYDCHLNAGSKVNKVYANGADVDASQGMMISERHRHRYEVNINYREKLERVGLRFSGLSPDGNLPELVELEGLPW